MMTPSNENNFSALLAFCERDPPVTGGFPSWRLATRSFDVFFELRLNKRLGKQSKRRWFQTLSCSLWSYCNANDLLVGGLVWYQKYTLCWHKEKWWVSMYVIPVLSILRLKALAIYSVARTSQWCIQKRMNHTFNGYHCPNGAVGCVLRLIIIDGCAQWDKDPGLPRTTAQNAQNPESFRCKPNFVLSTRLLHWSFISYSFVTTLHCSLCYQVSNCA